MRAVVADAFGEARCFAIREITMPSLDVQGVRVQIHAAAVNFVDTLVAAGRYQVKPILPFTPGGEFAGVVKAIGTGVQRLRVGDRVCGSGLSGAHAESIVAPEDAIHKIPDAMDFVEGARFRVGNMTALHALLQRGQVQPRELVVVLGAGGGVGFAAVQIAKALGARVIASASNDEKRRIALHAGADAVIPSEAENWRDQLSAAAEGKAVDVIVDPVGGDETERAFRSLGWGGRHLMIGFATGQIARLPTNLPLVKSASLIGVNIREFNARFPGACTRNMEMLATMWDEGKLRTPPIAVYPFDAFAQAMEDVANRSTVGRAVLMIRD